MEQRKDKGVAGLTILLSLITILFMIGLIVMVFSLMSGELADTDTLYQTSGTLSIVNESLTTVTEAGENLAVSGYRDVICTIATVINATDNVIITTANYTASNCNLVSSGTGAFNNTNWNVTYTYTFSADTGAVSVINDSSSSIASVTDWYDIFIVIGAMVVLILLVVIIITAIRSSGLVQGDSSGRANNVGTA